jgi:cation:H+ antiporter
VLILTLSIIAGLTGLFLGGELLVRGAVAIAGRLGISHLVTGVVIVGAATSMPEMVASVEAALLGSPGIAWGNVVGSNLANILLILGLTAMIAPIALHGVGKRDAVFGLVATLALWALAAAQIAAVWIGDAEDEEPESAPLTLPLAIALFGGGLALLVGAGQLLVTGAIELATIAGVSETVIGLTIVAVGTSLPELAATLAAAMRGRPDLAVGNVVGSNIFNLLLIGGATMAIAPMPVPAELLDLELPVLAGTSLLLLALCRYAKHIGRMLGLLLFAGFSANTVLLFA